MNTTYQRYSLYLLNKTVHFLPRTQQNETIRVVSAYDNHSLTHARSNKPNHTLRTGYVTRIELQKILKEVIYQDFEMSHIEILYNEFDRDDNGKIDFSEFKVMVNFLKAEGRRKKASRTQSVSVRVSCSV